MIMMGVRTARHGGGPVRGLKPDPKDDQNKAAGNCTGGCNGSGEKWLTYTDERGRTLRKKIDCDACEGTGNKR